MNLTGNLDPELADEIMDLFLQFNQVDITVLVATHDHRHLERIESGVLALANGQLVGAQIHV